MQDFRNLKVWQKAHSLTLDVYRTTKSFPADERYGLTSQLRRSCSSVPANLAEECARGGDVESVEAVRAERAFPLVAPVETDGVPRVVGRAASVSERRLVPRSGLPDHIDPTTLHGELFIFEIALSPRWGKHQYDEVYHEIASAIAAAVAARPEAKPLIAGRSFVRALH